MYIQETSASYRVNSSGLCHRHTDRVALLSEEVGIADSSSPRVVLAEERDEGEGQEEAEIEHHCTHGENAV